MTTKKELLKEHGNNIVASTHLTNTSGVIIHYIDDYNDKLLASIVTGDKVISSHYIKFNHNGAFRIGSMYFNINEFIRVN